MWSSITNSLENNSSIYNILEDEKILTFKNVLELLNNNDNFVIFFNNLLKESSYEAYFWEVKPIKAHEINKAFEFVLINSPALSKITADKSAFSNYFMDNQYVTTFLNLGGDSRLIVPVELSNSTNYSHLANFVRSSSQEQIIAFWNLVSEEFNKSLSDKIKYLSTSGLGVHWLHVRIDTKPKYYNYNPYKLMI